MVKRVSILLLLVLLSVGLFGGSAGVSFSIRTAQESDLLDYQFSSSVDLQNLSAWLEYERENGKTFLNYQTDVFYAWKYLKLKTSRNKIQDKIDKIYIEAIGRIPVEQKFVDWWLVKILTNGYFGLGLRQTWDKEKEIPKTNIILSKSYLKELNFFLVPAKIEYSLNFISADFKEWKKESNFKLNINILASLDVFALYKLIENDWFQFKTGIEVNF